MNRWLTVADILRINAVKFPDKEGAADLYRSLTFKQWNERCCRLANALAGLGLKKGDRVAMIAYNCLEWLEFYGACAKARPDRGAHHVPADPQWNTPTYSRTRRSSAFIVEKPFVQGRRERRSSQTLPTVDPGQQLPLHGRRSTPPKAIRGPGTDLFAGGDSPEEPPRPRWWTRIRVDHHVYLAAPLDAPRAWCAPTSPWRASTGPTSRPWATTRDDRGLLVMPMCHINSVFYSFVFTCLGATAVVYNSVSFDPEHMIKTLSRVRHHLHLPGAHPLHHDAGPARGG